jgi:HEAT repeat protein
LRKPRTITIVAAALLAMALSLRLCRPPPAPSPPAPELELPVLPVPSPEAAAPRRAVAPALPDRPDAARLRPFLEKLGRARLLRDRRTLDRLRQEVPPIFDTDFETLYAWLGADLFVSAGVAEAGRMFGRQDAVSPLAAVLGKAAHPFLKDVVIDALASLGGDAAAAALVGTLRGDADDSVRLRCASALGGFSGPEALRALIDALRDPSARVRTSAGAALARMNATGAVDLLLNALRDERDPAAQADLIVSAYAAGGEGSRAAVTGAILDRPAAGDLLRSRMRLRGPARYRRPYDRAFFEPGGPTVPFDASRRRIGITLESGSGVSPREVGSMLFNAAPLDRYRAWFYLRKADDFPATTAYDSFGNAMEDVPYGDSEGAVFLHFKDPASFEAGVLGYTKGCHAFVQGTSLLHEFGHAFARLGDEYAEGSREEAPNLFRQAAVPWMPLIESGLLGLSPRRDPEFYIPSENCYLNNSLTQSRYCPVCQLELHARVSELAGAPLPW